MTFLLILIIFFAPIVSASSYVNVNGKTYQSTNNGSISVVNGIVIDGNVVSGGGLAGNKKMSTQTRKLSPFSQLIIKLNANVEIIQSQDSPSITILAEENIIPIIKSSIENKQLILDSDKDFWTSKGIKIKIYTTHLDTIKIDGSANVSMQAINQEKLSLLISGSGDISVSGQVKQLSAIIEGSGDMRLENLKSNSAMTKINGAGDIRVYATDKLIAEINGSGDISYKGNPQELKKSINGSGDIDEL